MGIEYWLPRGVLAQPRLQPPGPAASVATGAEDEPVPEAVSEPQPRAEAVPAGGPEPVAGLGWEALEARVAACTACPEPAANRSRTVFGVGDRRARWMIIGEAPGAEEDRQGEPFVGRAGKLLNAMLAAVGLRREEVYIANILKCRPPGNRDPRPEEAQACRPFLLRQIELVSPRLLLVVGRIAAHNLLHTDLPLGRLRGRLHRHEDSGLPVVVTYHPAYLLRNPADKAKAWQDLKFARRLAERPTEAGPAEGRS